MAVKISKLKELKREIPFMWKPQTCGEYQALCVAYVDARDVQNLLDDVVGPENWSVEYQFIGDQMFARVGILIDYEDNKEPKWLYKMDTGMESQSDGDKGLISDCFKRASVVWGVGRFLYDQEIQKLKTKQYTNKKHYPVDDKGNILWTATDLTEYINTKLKGNKKKPIEAPEKVKGWSSEVQEKAKNITKNNRTGSACLLEFLPKYCKEKKLSVTKLSELNTDEKLLDLITWVEKQPPEGMIEFRNGE